jgi:Na+/proline symporter
VFFWDDVQDAKFFPRQFISGAFIALAMTGLDQDMMQKNLTCRTLKDAQKNMFWFSLSLVVVNLLFLVLGLLLTRYADIHGVALSGDQLFPGLALDGTLGVAVAFFFMIGLVAAAYSSADSALAALTTSFCVDFLGMTTAEAPGAKATRIKVHLAISMIMALLIVAFKYVVSENVIREVFVVAGYTYGPLLGLFFFGLYSKRKVRDGWVPFLAIAAPMITYGLNRLMQAMDWGQLGFEAMLVNGGLTWLFLWLASFRQVPTPGQGHQETAG